MATAASPVPVLKDEEWALIRELLDREHRELLMEIRHTDARDFRIQLKHRLEMVESLLGRVDAMRRP